MLSYKATTDNRGNTTAQIIQTGSIAFDNSYPTGGEPFDVRQLQIRYLDSIVFEPIFQFSFQYDYVNNKVRAFLAGVEVANGNDLSALNLVRFVAIGT